MWEFPSIQAFVNNNWFIVLWSFGALVFSALAWFHVYSSIKNKTKESHKDFVKNLAIGFFSLAASMFGLIVFGANYKAVSKCRNFEITNIKALSIKKMTDEESFTGSTILFSDTIKIQEGLQKLRNANSSERKKVKGGREKFINGYQIQLIAENEQNAPTLYYFSQTNNSQNRNVVIPYCKSNPDPNKIDNADDVYSSQAFGDWLRENIEPLFKSQ